jgi:hypothetical protein
MRMQILFYLALQLLHSVIKFTKPVLKHVFELPVHKHRPASYLRTYVVKLTPLNRSATRDLWNRLFKNVGAWGTV